MSAVKLYVDEDASEHAVVTALRQHGIDAITATGAGRERLSDEEQLKFAAALGRTLYSLNVRHFAALHRKFLARGKDHAGIILIPRQRYSVGEKIRRLQQFLASKDAESLKNSLHFL